MEGDSVEYEYIDSIAKRYSIEGIHTDVSNYFQIDIQDSLTDSLAIDKIDIWLDEIGIQAEE